ncbi:hypothetical protein [Hoeflea sp.]|uniref:hypothetical protein n=1 Tax=Hoeflea sp. TaxID=1940281 RepID=UPI0019AEFFFD|nr:hypothetical protein [Hoeflea sp.]MBC7282666.1 hypothetical protein [Hoeflea sp.]
MKFNFAHLIGGKPRGKAAVKAADPSEEEPAAEEDDPEAEGEDDDPEAEGEEDDPEAEGEEDDPEAEGEDDKPAARTKPKAARETAALAAARKAGFKAGRKAERARIGTILSAPQAAGRLDLAMSLAVNSAMPAAAAVASLSAAPKTSRLATLMPDRDPKIGAASPAADDKRVATAGARYRASRGLKD